MALALVLLGMGFVVAAAGVPTAADEAERPLQPDGLAQGAVVLPPVRAPERVALVKATVPSEACSRAMDVVARAGLQLEVSTAFRCPGNTETTPGDRQHSGVACWDHPRYCPEGAFIAVNPEHIREGDDRMQYVIAHEICHISSYVAVGIPGTEDAADACAAAAGFPR